MGAFGHALISALLILIGGYLGSFLGLAGCMIMTAAVSVGCIVYHLERRQKKDETRAKKSAWHKNRGWRFFHGCLLFGKPAYFTRTFFSFAKRGRESSLGSLGSPWIRGST